MNDGRNDNNDRNNNLNNYGDNNFSNYNDNNFVYYDDNNFKKTHRKGKFKTVLIATLATVAFGLSVGFGGSLALGGIIKELERDGSSIITPSKDDDIDRSNLPDVINPTKSDKNNDNNTDGNNSNIFSNDGTGNESGEELTTQELYERLSDTVVGIKLGKLSNADNEEIIGSGVVISEDGFVITCAHVVEGSEDVIVVVDNYDDPDAPPNEYSAKVYGMDTPTDLAVLKIDSKETFDFAPIGGSSNLKIGQKVTAIGNPLGLVKTMTQGIVSGLQRDIGDNSYTLPSIQTDAAINPGNSGCPLFDMYGNVVGIVNIKLVYGSALDNLGFAISIDEALPIIEELASNGRVTTRPMLGITARSVYPEYDGTEVEGLMVETIDPNAPVSTSGLSRGDIIYEIDGEKVVEVSDVQSILKTKNAGDAVEVKVLRYDNFGKTEKLTFVFALTTT